MPPVLLQGRREGSLPSPPAVARETEPQKVQPGGPAGECPNVTPGCRAVPPRALVQPSTYLVTSGAEVGRTVFLRASIQFLRIPEVMADKV